MRDKDSGEKTVGIKANADKNAFAFARSELFGGLGAMSFAFVCHHSTFIVHNSMMVQTEKECDGLPYIHLDSFIGMYDIGFVGYLSFFGLHKRMCSTILAAQGHYCCKDPSRDYYGIDISYGIVCCT